DTFRAAANEQLEIWAKRAGVEIISSQKGNDPSSIAFETVKKAVQENYDIVLIDTAGRLHNKTNLMNELSKIKKVIQKFSESAPHETLLVVDGTTGQNAVVQATEFSKVIDLSGLVITKLDGTAKGGVVFQISKKLNIPIKFIGVGEGIEDLQEFDKDSFISALFDIKEG
ncbi:MAG: signal recognition particle-docking protein FtsY, partial [Ignavibacterium sp.]